MIKKIYNLFKILLAISKVAIPVLEEIFHKDLDGDGKIGKKERDVTEA